MGGGDGTPGLASLWKGRPAGQFGACPIRSRESLKVFHQGREMIKAVFRGDSGRVWTGPGKTGRVEHDLGLVIVSGERKPELRNITDMELALWGTGCQQPACLVWSF